MAILAQLCAVHIPGRSANRHQSLKACQQTGEPIVVEKAKLILPLDSTLKIQFPICAGSVRGDITAPLLLGAGLYPIMLSLMLEFMPSLSNQPVAYARLISSASAQL